ncbi:hypothetical protein [Blastopirellula marina]|uniref:Flagellar protein FliL n=1 Tax=Blastopirellula marina TaxID=124 RepID=A0A2S8FLR9_9BACT|nr:hypothetical protein [Blastopirellula marina]PQO32960.1 hypothetical protein C5Y98_17635 [Blastopirellula marina]PTL43127.1 hypothetical protein C5Y97_17645 [Blastopirellula marina]
MDFVSQGTNRLDLNVGTGLLLALALVAMCGCERAASADEELLLSLEKRDWVEIDLGDFNVSVLVADDPTRQPDLTEYQESVALHYQLHCLVARENEAKVRAFLEERKGEISDEIIRTCRHANLIDLADPELQLIRSQLRDFTEEFMGPGIIKRFVFSNVVLERF